MSVPHSPELRHYPRCLPETLPQRAYLAAIVESSLDAILGMTLDGIVVSWNAGAERLFGYSVADMVGRSMSRLVAPDDPDELPRNLVRVGRVPCLARLLAHPPRTNVRPMCD
jgi:PAS domain-containing protein